MLDVVDKAEEKEQSAQNSSEQIARGHICR